MSQTPQRLRDDDGLTLVEVLVAVLLLSGGLLATLAVFNSGQRASAGSTRAQNAYAIAQSRLEAIVATPWAALAMDPDPAKAPVAVAGTPSANLRNCTTSPPGCTQLAIFANPGDASPLPSGDVVSPENLFWGATAGCTGCVVAKDTSSSAYTVYQYVTEASDSKFTTTGTPAKTFTARRITVAVQLASSVTKSVTKPVWVSTVVADPNTAPAPG